MKLTRLAILLPPLVLTAACLAVGAQNDTSPLAGAWDCVAHGTVQGDVPFTMTLKQDKESLTGTIHTADFDLEISSGSYKDGVFEVVLNAPDAKYTVKGKVDGNKLSGRWTKEGDDGNQDGPWEGKRSAGAAAAAKQNQ